MSLPGHLVELPSGRVFVHRSSSSSSSASASSSASSAEALPLVLLHGYLLSHWIFLPVLSSLGRHRPLVLLDLPGHGESDRPSPIRFRYDLPCMADTVVQVLDALGIERAAFLGHSFGGAIALTLCARHPQRCERLVVVDGMVYPSPLLPEAQVALLPVLGELVFRGAYSKGLLRRVFRQTLFRDPDLVTPTLVDYYWERESRAGGREAMHACLQTLATLGDDNSDVGRVTAQTLVVWGEDDRTAPLDKGQRLAREIPGARLAVIAGCGHTPFVERPDRFCAAVESFLDEGMEGPTCRARS